MAPSVSEVVLGSLLIAPWYRSFYPDDVVGPATARLYVCPSCFRYAADPALLAAHARRCPLSAAGPPGTAIYAKAGFALQEVDGEAHKLFCQNLSLFAKLFLDTKSVFFDVGTFLYYVLVADAPTPPVVVAPPPPPSRARSRSRQPQEPSPPPPPQRQIVGFFSKEKLSWDNNNLACILVFPPWQRQGLGQILMGASYALSKREGRLGGPEKPLSDLGRRGYQAYWSHAVARALLAAPSRKPLSVRALCEATYIVKDDVVATLQAMGVLEQRADAARPVINKAKVRAWALEHKASLTPPVHDDAFLLPPNGAAEGRKSEGPVGQEEEAEAADVECKEKEE